jgi:oligoendopeptidase F
MSEYMGPAVLQSAGSHRWWIYWSHIRAYFYNYSYAFGLLISKLMQARVRQDGAYIAQVKTFLSAGTSASPQEVLKSIGIDITAPLVWQEGIDQVKKNLQAVV